MNSMASAPPPGRSPSALIISASDVQRRRTAILFEENGFRVMEAGAAQPSLPPGALDADLVILDLTPGDADPLGIYRRAIASGWPPTIVLSERSTVVDEIVVLELGADSLLAKPADDRLLLARARALLRRIPRAAPSLDSLGGAAGAWRLAAGSLKAVSPGGREVKLTAGEIAIFGHFLRHPGATLTVEGAARAIGADLIGPSGFRSALCRLRRKLARAGDGDPIRNVWGVGYAYVTEESAPAPEPPSSATASPTDAGPPLPWGFPRHAGPARIASHALDGADPAGL